MSDFFFRLICVTLYCFAACQANQFSVEAIPLASYVIGACAAYVIAVNLPQFIETKMEQMNAIAS